MAIAIRAATPADIEALARLWKEMWDAQAALDPRMQANPMAELVMRRWIEEHLDNPRSCILAAEEAGAVVGYALGTILENPPLVPHQFYGYFSDLAVTAAARRAGVGTRLAGELHAWFRERRLPYVTVNVAVSNAVARGFWRKQGYSDFVEQLRMEL